jgi:methionine synthase I (cobalamin-dependent)
MRRFEEALRSGRVLLMDGAMGTELMRAGWWLQDRLERLNVTQPERVAAIHAAYVAAGAEVLLTNTFQANPQRYSMFEFSLVQLQGIRLAREAAGDRFVVADIGPLPALDAYAMDRPLDRLAAAHDIDPGLERGAVADGILLETFSSIPMARAFAERRAVLRLTVPLLVSFTMRRAADGTLRTFHDALPAECARFAAENNVAALGINCGKDLRLPELLEIVAAYRSVTNVPIFVRPNAGTPRRLDGKLVYPETPESMAAWLPELLDAGVVMVGGCCGTTPEHIAAFRKVVDEWNARREDESSEPRP